MENKCIYKLHNSKVNIFGIGTAYSENEGIEPELYSKKGRSFSCVVESSNAIETE